MIDLAELFRDDAEIEGLLEAYEAAYGAEDERDPGVTRERKPRERLIEIVEGLGEARIISLLITYAQGFASMVQEICDLCEESGIGIGGQISFLADHVDLRLSPLDAGWIYAGAAIWTSDLMRRADTLAAEIEGMSRALPTERQLRHRKLIIPKSDRERYLDPRAQLRAQLREELIRDADPDYYSFFAEVDVRTMRALCGQIAELSGRIAPISLGSGISSAIAQLERHARSMQRKMEAGEVRREQPNRTLQSIAAHFEAVASAVARMAQRATEGRRAEAGLADFLRTDFWPYRWRVYELWLLVRVLRVLQANGGRIALLDVEAGAWKLSYSRSNAPVAHCEIGGEHLDIFYQLYEKAQTSTHTQKADMPDIAVRRADGQYLFVLDPKHGRTYSRRKVEEVLDRYHERLQADVTAIVNYMDMAAYPFVRLPTKSGVALLASDVAPRGRGIEPLEKLFAASLRAAGCAQRSQSHEVIPMAPDRNPARAARLLYWADRAREVDEPAGLWMVEEDGGPIPLHGSRGDAAKITLDAMHVSADGSACLIASKAQVTILRDGQKSAQFLPGSRDFSQAAWSPDHRKFAIRGYEAVIITNEDGREVGTIPVKNIKDVCWLDNEHLMGVSWASIVRIALPNRWEVVREGNFDDFRVISLGPGKGVLIGALGHFEYKIDGDGSCAEVDRSSELRAIRSVSPSGRHHVLDGPRSLRGSEGVRLLTIKDTADQPVDLPLVRFVAQRISFDIQWSPDETRAAFLLTPAAEGNGFGRLMSFRLGDRHAATVSMPDQKPSFFAWLKPSLVTQLKNSWDRMAEASSNK
jgi:hypothetical protein